MDALETVEAWDVGSVAVAAVAPDGSVTSYGDLDQVFRLASLTKLMTTYAALIAVEEGSSRSTIRSARRAHAAPPARPRRRLPVRRGAARGITGRRRRRRADGAEPSTGADRRRGRRRIYSNTGIEVAAEHVADRTQMPFAHYLRESVLEPLAMRSTELRGSPAHGMRSTLADVLRFVEELRAPSLIDRRRSPRRPRSSSRSWTVSCRASDG